MRLIAIVWSVLAACYSPAYRDCEITCASGSCPSGLRCEGGFCREPGMTASCGTLPPQEAGVDTGIDAVPLGPWSMPVQVVGTPGGIEDPAVTSDLLEMFASDNGTIVVAQRQSPSVPWGGHSIVGGAVESGAGDYGVDVSGDGLTLIVWGLRSGGLGSQDLWEFRRPTRMSPWALVGNLTVLNSPERDGGAAVSADGLTVVFDSARSMNDDLYISQRMSVTQPWSAPMPITALNTTAGERSPMLSVDKLTIYYHALVGGADELYVAHRNDLASSFGAISRITELNSQMNDADPWVSADQRLVYFASDRGGAAIRAIYEAKR